MKVKITKKQLTGVAMAIFLSLGSTVLGFAQDSGWHKDAGTNRWWYSLADQYQSPKLVVMETNFFLTSLRKKRILLAKYLPIFNYHELYKEYLLYPESADKWKGFSATNQAMPYTGTLDYMTADSTSYPVDSWTLEYMRQRNIRSTWHTVIDGKCTKSPQLDNKQT